MNDRLDKAHTKEYLQLRELAGRLDGIWSKTQHHTHRTIASVRRDLNAQWDAHVTHLIAGGSKPGTINAARRRLEEGKNLLSFLDNGV